MIQLKEEFNFSNVLEIKNQRELLSYFKLSEYVDHVEVGNLLKKEEVQVVKISIFDEYNQEKSIDVNIKMKAI